MRRPKLLLAAGAAAFLVFLAAMVPATLLTRWMPPGVAVSRPEGTIWSGRTRSVSWQGRALGAADWSCRPWRLVFREWACRVRLRPPGGELSGSLSGSFGGRLEGRDVAGALPIALLEGLLVPAGWSGRLELDLDRVRVADGDSLDAQGLLVLRELKAPGPNGAVLGDFELALGQGAVGTGLLTGRLRDLGGPLRVRGTVELRDDHSYLASGDVAPGPGAGQTIQDTLASLGPPDSLGRRRFTVEGTL